jgi:hypothetical protein
MWPFRRKPRGRHALGAAVRAIPSGPPASAPAVLPPAPRVELGFRDGTSAALAPGSPQAKALTEIAAILTQRD